MAIILKHDPTDEIDENWLLERGQPGVELAVDETKTPAGIQPKLKVGDGEHVWKDLPYISPDPSMYTASGINCTNSKTWQILSANRINIDSTFNMTIRSNSHQFFESPTAGTESAGQFRMCIDKKGVYTNNVVPAELGLASNPWAAIYSTTGTVQTSDKASKDSIRYLDEMEELPDRAITLNTNSILDLIRQIRPATFCYKHAEHKADESNSKDCQIQLGLIADDIKDHPVYKYIGIEHYDEEAQRTRLGLQPLPIAIAALTACKKLLEENDALKAEIKEIKEKLK